MSSLQQTDVTQPASQMQPGRLALILAAERLIAVHGIAGVSLRQIADEAGHKNASAVHYHFGAREGLVEGVLAYRMPGINARREKLLEDGPLSKLDMRALVCALAYPLAEELKPRHEGNCFLRFSERIARERDLIAPIHTFSIKSLRVVQDELTSRLSALPTKLATLRTKMAWDQIISGLAIIEATMDRRTWSGDNQLAVQALIDFVTAGVGAPPADERAARPASTRTVIKPKARGVQRRT